MQNVIALPPRGIQLTLNITDPEVTHELERHADGTSRETFALQALRLGVLALRQASGALDADVIRRQGEHLMGNVGSVLNQHNAELTSELNKTMQHYFDPASGSLPQRIERLTKSDGELDGLIARHVQGDQSSLAQTLVRHIGEQSPLFKLLSPERSDGILAALSETLEKALTDQRDEVLKQFSLDQKESALSRLLSEVSTSNGKLREGLAEDVTQLANEFSLDNEDGALSRLVKRVERTQRTITEELSLDHEGSALKRLSRMLETTNQAVATSLTLDNDQSPLARLKREILDVLKIENATNAKFHSEVRSTLETFKTHRAAAARTPLHGVDFEAQLGELLDREVTHLGDVCEAVGSQESKTQRRKLGDFVIELGTESAAAGARIVVEAKANKGYSLKQASKEIATARQSRDAQIGLFVFERDSAPANMEPLHRVGNDVFVVWAADDSKTDLYLKLALGLARALACRERVSSKQNEADFDALDKLVETIAGHIQTLESIEKAASAARKSGDNIVSSAQKMRSELNLQVAQLRGHVNAVRDGQLAN